jgi:hypothetical protein
MWALESGIPAAPMGSGCRSPTWQTQHKGAAWAHTAGDINPLFKRDFAHLTCVERIIKCTGNCK